MGRVRRPRMSASEKAELWKRWKRGESLSDIGRALLKRDVPIVRVDQVWSTDSGFLWRGEQLVSRLPA